MNKIAIFASGSGSNAEKIAEYFNDCINIEIDCILTNNPKAYVLERFKESNIEKKVFTRDEFYHSDAVLGFLKERGVNFIVLAGFLWLVPDYLTMAYERKIINIHPALLPKFGGKGMYGKHVHEAVVKAGEKESGITIHFVNGKYDEGDIIFQAKCMLEPDDTAETVAQKVHQLEYEHFPRIIKETVNKLK